MQLKFLLNSRHIRRNARLFEDVETPMVELRKRLLNTLYSWIAPYRSLSVFTFVDFLNLFSVQPA